MSKVNEFGRLLFDGRSRKPVDACALLQAGQIDPDWIFLKEEDARHRVALEHADQEDVVPVTIVGGEIYRT